MNMTGMLQCNGFPCTDVYTDKFLVPDLDINFDRVKMLMISEGPPRDPLEYFYAPDDPFYMQTTKQVFRDAGITVSSIKDIIDLGVYITTAVKCPKTDLSISSKTIQNCSVLLDQEIKLLQNLKVIILNGDVAIKSLNTIVKKNGGTRVIPAGSTYKIRNQPYFYHEIRVFPSYILTGKNLLIEKSKRRMISEDIQKAIELI